MASEEEGKPVKMRALLAAFIATVVGLLGAVEPASASTSAVASASSSTFEAQDRAQGLSPSQAVDLQNEVDGYLAKIGGTQVAINKIDLDGGYLLLPLPGEAYARDLSVHPTPTDAAATCYVDDFCVWEMPDYNGAFMSKYICSSFTMPWVTTGTWLNNQTGGARARFYGSRGNLIYTTPPPVSSDTSYNWSPVFTILPC